MLTYQHLVDPVGLHPPSILGVGSHTFPRQMCRRYCGAGGPAGASSPRRRAQETAATRCGRFCWPWGEVLEFGATGAANGFKKFCGPRFLVVGSFCRAGGVGGSVCVARLGGLTNSVVQSISSVTASSPPSASRFRAREPSWRVASARSLMGETSPPNFQTFALRTS